MFFDRVKYKEDAKIFLRKNYFKAFLVSLITILLGGASNPNINFNNGSNKTAAEIESILGTPMGLSFIYIFTGIILFAILFQIFVGFAISVGGARFFVREEEDIFTVFDGFSDNYMRTVKVCSIVFLKTFLGLILFIIPGIIIGYRYRLVPYILSERKELSVSEVLEEARNLTDGHKGNLFIMDLSFIGWQLLGSLAFGIGAIFVQPYIDASFANAYKDLAKPSNAEETKEIGINLEKEEERHEINLEKK